jgi:mannose-1-phosphate guanylyltransferase / mannose-6-phosphate isomerase
MSLSKETKPMLIPVILSGGVGSRLWPLSREHYPKQLLALTGGNDSLLQQTIQRLHGIPALGEMMIIANESQRFLLADQLSTHTPAPKLVLEPLGRNTAPALAIAAHLAIEQDPDAVLLVMPADHLIQDVGVFHAAVAQAQELVAEGFLVTFGIVPTQAESGYGYIKAGLPLKSGFRVAEFVEKPAPTLAATYVASGDYYWNSGMFVLKAAHYLHELTIHAPDIALSAEQAFATLYIDIERGFLRLEEDSFGRCRSESIDYAVMEKTAHAAVLPLAAGWSDIGAWSSLWEVSPHDESGNACYGDVLAMESHNSYLRAEYRLLATLGVDNIIAVETADAVLVAHKDRVQDVKTLVAELKKTHRGEADLHREVHRPWGTYETLDHSARFKVKRIKVKPGASLSLQLHYHRSEHWIVVRGTAKIHRADESFLLSENQSAYIPLGTPHRLENPGKITLEIIEVQSGTYLEEDDIVRFDDHYGR